MAFIIRLEVHACFVGTEWYDKSLMKVLAGHGQGVLVANMHGVSEAR